MEGDLCIFYQPVMIMFCRYVYIFLITTAFIVVGCSSARPMASEYQRTASIEVSQAENSSLKQAMEPAIRAHAGKSGFHLVTSGEEALLTRIAMIQAAERSVDIQYYSIQDDGSGK